MGRQRDVKRRDVGRRDGRATEVAGAAGRRRAADAKAGTADMDLRPRTPAGSAPNPEEG